MSHSVVPFGAAARRWFSKKSTCADVQGFLGFKALLLRDVKDLLVVLVEWRDCTWLWIFSVLLVVGLLWLRFCVLSNSVDAIG